MVKFPSHRLRREKPVLAGMLCGPGIRNMVSLSKGRRGPDVERWRRFLMQRGFLQGEAYQQQQGLKVDGIVGALTLAKPVYEKRADTRWAQRGWARSH